MDMKKFKKTLGDALSNTTLVENAFGYVCDLNIARRIACDVLMWAIEKSHEKKEAQELVYKKIAQAIEQRLDLQDSVDAIERTCPLISREILERSKAVICTMDEKNLSDLLREPPSPLALPTQNQGAVMTQWFLCTLTLIEWKVILLLRFRDASSTSVAEDLKIHEAEVKAHANTAKEKIRRRKNASDWQQARSINEAPTKTGFLENYETVWRQSVENLAYLILGDINGARKVADKVKAEALSEKYDFDMDTAWHGNDRSWTGFKKLTFDESRTLLIEYSEFNQHHAKPKRDDIWAKRVQMLSMNEKQFFLLATFFYQRDKDGIYQISKSMGIHSKEISKHITKAVKKMLQTEKQGAIK